ncbi:MAG: FAD-binding protein [Desulfosarcina sp.]|nr:FAD-binding protein [Desulfosarcina sp.]MBC2742390.1 FAD-binding protein [Desulfosarcina sp.]MBC2765300.1 FAD-binding protein [Desulfosarcina sp.]
MRKYSTASFEKLADRIDGDVSWCPLDRILLATDGSIFSREPAAAVYPKHTGDVVETVIFARQQGLSVHPRGAGSGLCGSALGTGIVVDFTRYMNRLICIDYASKTFACEPGYRFGELEQVLKGRGLFFPPDPSSGEYASFGGMVGTNASGAHSVKYGNVSDYLLDAQVVCGTGEVITFSKLSAKAPEDLPEPFASLAAIYRENRDAIESAYPPVRYNVAGYNLRGLVKDGHLHLEKLFAGAEGTLGIATRLTFRLLNKPAHDSLVVAFFDAIDKAALAVQEILPMGPAGIEVMDRSLLELARSSDPVLRERIPGGIDNVLLVEFDGDEQTKTEALGRRVRKLLTEKALSTKAHLAVSAEEKKRFWAVRKAAVPILYRLKGEKKILAIIEDAAVPTDRLVDYFSGIYDILNRNGVRFVVYGHIAKGLLHTRPLLNLRDPADIAMLKTLADAVFSLVNGLGGVVSGEHGDGRLRSTYIQRQYLDIFPLFQQTKRLLDPHNLMNPEIKIASTPDQMMQHLRYGSGYRHRDSAVSCLNWEDGWHEEIEKCHGCTKCTTVTTATRMCPIYKFTRKEAAAPKAKANVLRALISGALDDAALYEEAFQAVIDQCVGCGSCRLECPSNVDIPKMALEARARYIKRFGPSFHSRLVTGAETLGRYGGSVSSLLKPAMDLRLMRRAGEMVSGISSRRPFVPIARRSLFRRVAPVAGAGRVQVLYFSGCYAGYIRPHIGTALVQALTRLGMTVHTPPQHCCGLPLLTKGRADAAREKVRQNLARWQRLLDRVDHIVVTCSSCGLALMDEWSYLMDGPRIRRVADKVIHASRLIHRYMDGVEVQPLQLQMSTAYHQPCHLKVQPDPRSSVAMLTAVPELTMSNLDSHCCGMAGTWGLAAKNDGLSRTIGSHLINLIDASGADAAVTDCPTCEMQMAQLGTRPVLHPVEIMAQCMVQ